MNAKIEKKNNFQKKKKIQKNENQISINNKL